MTQVKFRDKRRERWQMPLIIRERNVVCECVWVHEEEMQWDGRHGRWREEKTWEMSGVGGATTEWVMTTYLLSTYSKFCYIKISPLLDSSPQYLKLKSVIIDLRRIAIKKNCERSEMNFVIVITIHSYDEFSINWLCEWVNGNNDSSGIIIISSHHDYFLHQRFFIKYLFI